MYVRTMVIININYMLFAPCEMNIRTVDTPLIKNLQLIFTIYHCCNVVCNIQGASAKFGQNSV